jgi:hypothetical protein
LGLYINNLMFYIIKKSDVIVNRIIKYGHINDNEILNLPGEFTDCRMKAIVEISAQ